VGTTHVRRAGVLASLGGWKAGVGLQGSLGSKDALKPRRTTLGVEKSTLRKERGRVEKKVRLTEKKRMGPSEKEARGGTNGRWGPPLGERGSRVFNHLPSKGTRKRARANR